MTDSDVFADDDDELDPVAYEDAVKDPDRDPDAYDTTKARYVEVLPDEPRD